MKYIALQKVYGWSSCPFALTGESFWQKDSLIIHTLFELQPIMIFSLIANQSLHLIDYINSDRWIRKWQFSLILKLFELFILLPDCKTMTNSCPNENREVVLYEVSLNCYLETIFILLSLTTSKMRKRLSCTKTCWTENLLT